MFDDLGTPLDLRRPPRRVVSLVPSQTEALAVSAPGLLVGATDWCTRPADLDVARVGGTKSPDLAAVLSCRPDLVVANEEENRAGDVAALRREGVAVWVTSPRSLDGALASLTRMLRACGVGDPAWLDAAREAWAPADPRMPARASAVVPIWRRPWMVLGRDTFAGDLLRRLGVTNAYGCADSRYPKVPADDLRAAADLVVLPDEPYAFSPCDGPEEFPGLPVALVSGRHLTWYGPSLVEARGILAGQLEPALAAFEGTG